MQGEVRAGGADGRGAAAAQAARTAGPDCEGWRAGAERTSNMPPISVTLDVSKLSGWLNTDASCRAQGGACDAGRGAGGGGRAWSGGGASGAQREGLTIKGWGAGAKRTSNMSRMPVTLDVSKLSGWLNTDASCRVERGAYEAG